MAQAATVSAAATEIEEVARGTGGAVPDHWTGRAARAYQRDATNLATGLGTYGERAHALAAAMHAHETEAAAIRSALAAGQWVAV